MDTIWLFGLILLYINEKMKVFIYITYISNITWKWILKIIWHFEKWIGMDSLPNNWCWWIPVHLSKCRIIFKIHFHVMLVIYEMYESFQYFCPCTTILYQIVRLYPNCNYQHHKKAQKEEFTTTIIFVQEQKKPCSP